MKYLFVLILFVGITACDKGVSSDEPLGNEVLLSLEESMAETDLAFQLEVFKEVVASKDEGKNAVLSPLSIYLALSMVYQGADNQTRQEMSQVLGFGNMDDMQVQEHHKLVQQFLQEVDPRSTFNVSNGIFYDDQRVIPAEEFIATNRDIYNAEVRKSNFGSEETLNDINGWVEEETNGLIKKIIEQIKAEEIMFVINALYYKGGWSEPFDKKLTEKRPFTLASGNEILVDMMSKDQMQQHIITEEYAAVDLPLGDSLFSMTFIDPMDKSPGEFVQDLSNAKLTSMWEKMQVARLALTVPSFELSVKYKLKDALSSMGMPSAFDEGSADFTQLGTAGGNIYLTRVDHKTYLKVDEEGAEGAAVTSVGVGAESIPPSIDLDSPFVFILRDRTFNQIVFIGIVENPNEEE